VAMQHVSSNLGRHLAAAELARAGRYPRVLIKWPGRVGLVYNGLM
jgi:hypothetical protein